MIDNDAQPFSIQQIVTHTFAELGARDPVIPTILLKDLHFAGHKFRCGALQAVWLANRDVIEFRDHAGQLLRSVTIDAAEKKQAA